MPEFFQQARQCPKCKKGQLRMEAYPSVMLHCDACDYREKPNDQELEKSHQLRNFLRKLN